MYKKTFKPPKIQIEPLRKTAGRQPLVPDLSRLRMAFVCDWLTAVRGGERCLKALCQKAPNADLFTLVYDPDRMKGVFDGHAVQTSFIQNLLGGTRFFRYYLPLFPKAIESFDFSGYDCVVSFSHCVAKGVKVPRQIPHICYCHTPVRYAWDMAEIYLNGLPVPQRWLLSLYLKRLRRWDLASLDRVTCFLANSIHIRDKIQRLYGRSARVIYPPVDLKRFSVSQTSGSYYLVLSALVPYKRVDLAVEAFNQNGKKLIVAGVGPEFRRLQKKAASQIEFVYGPDDSTVEQLYADCKALIFPGQEDFGIVPLEAQASGKPVIAYRGGGALETVIDSSRPQPTGLFFDQQTTPSLIDAVRRFESCCDLFDPQNCRQNAERFGVERFQKEMVEQISEATASLAEAGRSVSVHRSRECPS